MFIKLIVTPLNGGAPFEKLVKSQVAILGREKSCDVPLQDEQRMLSRQHFKLEVHGHSLQVTVLSKVNTITLMGRELGPEESMTAPANCEILAQPYKIRAMLVEESNPAPEEPGWLNAGFHSSVEPHPFADTLPYQPAAAASPLPVAATEPGSDHPFADFLDTGTPNSTASPSWPLPSSSFPDNSGPIAATPFPHTLPPSPSSGQENIQPFGYPGNSRAPWMADNGKSQPPGFAGSSADFGSQLTGQFGMQPVTSSLDHVHDFNLPFTPPPVPGMVLPHTDDRTSGTAGSPFDAAAKTAPSALDTGEPAPWINTQQDFPATAPFGQPQAVHPQTPLPFNLMNENLPPMQQVNQAVAPVRQNLQGMHAVPDFPAPSAIPVPAATPQSEHAVLLKAFYEGLGVPVPAGLDNTEARMREAGAMLRESIHGIMSLLIARAELKKEIRTEERTVLATRNNNPLKMMDDAGDALRYLCDPSKQLNNAFLPPVKAIKDACEDLQAHDLGLIAGAHAAISGTLRQFAPEKFEKKAGNDNLLQRLNRKAKLWELFVEDYQKISGEKADFIEHIIETEFSRAYTSHVNTIRDK